MLVTIFCRRPGLIRGGVRHPEFASYIATQFGEAQLREMIADPLLTVVVGHQLTAEQVHDFVTKHSPAGRADLPQDGASAAAPSNPDAGDNVAQDGAGAAASSDPDAGDDVAPAAGVRATAARKARKVRG